MPSATYRIFREAILSERQVTCVYQGRRREVCPVIIGRDKDGAEAVLAWQFAGESNSKRLPPGGAWKCLKLENVRNATSRDGLWHEGQSHQSEQSCVTIVDIDINIDVRKRR